MSAGFFNRTAVGCLFLLSFACAAGARQSSEPQPRKVLHWGASGSYALQINLVGLPIQHDVIFFYEHLFGKYPRFWNGVAENGGTPFRANLSAHLTKVSSDVTKRIPRVDYSGFVVIDFESWHPLWDLCPLAFRQGAVKQERSANPSLTEAQATSLARSRHEVAAKEFMVRTIEVCKSIRPQAYWGFFNLPADGQSAWVSATPWLWDACKAFYPAVTVERFGVESGIPGPGQQTIAAYRARVERAIGTARFAADGKPVLGVGWLRYPDYNPYYKFQFLSDLDLREHLRHQREVGADGLIFWDAINDSTLAAHYSRYAQMNLRPAVERLISEEPSWRYIPGDANSDGLVNYDDIFACLSAWGRDYRPVTGLGDANLDGLVDFSDLIDITSQMSP